MAGESVCPKLLLYIDCKAKPLLLMEYIKHFKGQSAEAKFDVHQSNSIRPYCENVAACSFERPFSAFKHYLLLRLLLLCVPLVWVDMDRYVHIDMGMEYDLQVERI